MKKLICIVFALVIVLSSNALYVGASSDKIDPELLQIMDTAGEEEKIRVIVWLEDVDYTEVEEAAKDQTFIQNPNMKLYANNHDMISIVENELLDEYIDIKREEAKEVYLSSNTKHYESIFPKERVGLFRTVELEQPEVTYISKYAPTIQLELTKEEIQTISNYAQVDTIYYDQPVEDGENQLNIATNITKTAYIRDTLGFKGDGIKIGMIEEYAVTPNSTHFTTSRLFADSSAPKSATDGHAEAVAYIMVGKNGIVPNASLYSTSVNRTGGWRAGVEWLLDQGVHVINISHSLGGTGGVYGSYSRWIDHVAIQHDVHVVIAAGNTSSTSALVQAGMGNNVICVGATNDKNTATLNDDIHYSGSRYVTTTYKPDLCAPGVAINNIPYREGESGTSFSAPQVTAAIAQLCQQKELLKTRQDLVKSILLAGTRQFETVSTSGSGNNIAMSYKIGSGVLDAKNSRYVNNSIRYRADTLTSGVNTFTHQFTVTSSDDFIRVCLSWLRNSRCSTSAHENESNPASVDLAQMTLTVTAPNGTKWCSTDTRGSVQLVAFVPPQTGTYTITIQRKTQTNTSTHFAVAWY